MLRVLFRVAIHAGKIEEFQGHASALCAMVAANCPETVEYQWFLDAGNAECVVLETFANSPALITHVNLVAPRAAQMFALCDIRDIWVCGDPSPAVLERTAAFAPGMYGSWFGKHQAPGGGKPAGA